MSNAPTTRVIIYFIDALDYLGNYIFINIYYYPISRILRGEIHHRRFSTKTDCLYPTSGRIELQYCHNVEAIEKIKGFYLVAFWR
jgi:hypothetical protein